MQAACTFCPFHVPSEHCTNHVVSRTELPMWWTGFHPSQRSALYQRLGIWLANLGITTSSSPLSAGGPLVYLRPRHSYPVGCALSCHLPRTQAFTLWACAASGPTSYACMWQHLGQSHCSTRAQDLVAENPAHVQQLCCHARSWLCQCDTLVTDTLSPTPSHFSCAGVVRG